jgi:hypothetical protein
MTFKLWGKTSFIPFVFELIMNNWRDIPNEFKNRKCIILLITCNTESTKMMSFNDVIYILVQMDKIMIVMTDDHKA